MTFSHISSEGIEAMARYSAFVLTQVITNYFLLFHETIFPPTNIQYPIVDLRSRLFLAQSMSV